MENRSKVISDNSNSNACLLGFDPGRDKCGIAVVGEDGTLYTHQVVNSQEAIATLRSLYQKFSPHTMVMGNQTTAKQWKQTIETQLPSFCPIVMVDERYSSLEARDRYWEMYPPKGLKRLIPQGMRLPPRPVDDIVAILLIERYKQLSVNNEQLTINNQQSTINNQQV